MATEKMSIVTPKTDAFANAAELMVDSINNAGKLREEMEKVGRDTLERTGVLVRASWQTALDGYDFHTKTMATWQKLAVEMVEATVGAARNVAGRAA
jgi:hypothetical protein